MTNVLTHRSMIKRFFHSFNFSTFRPSDLQTNYKHMKTIGVIIIMLAFHLQAAGQPGQGRRFNDRMEAIQARRIAHITDRLSLTPAEARGFWPVYNEYLTKQQELSQKHRTWSMQIGNIDQVSDEQAARIAEQEVTRLEESAALRRTYHEKLKEVLPIRKIAMLYEAERSFNQSLVRESQQRIRGRP